MKTNNAIEILASSRFAERIAKKIAPSLPEDDLDDLSQIAYLALLEKDGDFIAGLRDRGELEFYVIRILQRQLYSTTSPFYRKIRKFRDLSEPIDSLPGNDKNNLSTDDE